MAVKVYTPGQFYAAGGVVEEMFYQEVGRTKKYLRKRVGFILTLIIYGILVWSFMQLQEPSRDLLKKIGELLYLE